MTPPDCPTEPALAHLFRLGGAPALERMLTLFLDHTPDRIRGARDALRAHDPERLLETAYSIRSTSALVGADGLRGLAERLVDAALEQRTDGLDEVIAAMDTELAAVRAGWAGWLRP